MDCRCIRERLPALVRGELPAGPRTEVRRHLAGCPGCRRAWAALDPVGATQAFGPRRPAPVDLRDRIMAEVRMLPPPVRAGTPADTAMLGLAAAGVLGLWVTFLLTGPLVAGALATSLRALAATLATAGATAAVTLQIVNPVLPILAGRVVAAELALVGRWMRTAA